jgi:hypothetical protein
MSGLSSKIIDEIWVFYDPSYQQAPSFQIQYKDGKLSKVWTFPQVVRFNMVQGELQFWAEARWNIFSKSKFYNEIYKEIEKQGQPKEDPKKEPEIPDVKVSEEIDYIEFNYDPVNTPHITTRYHNFDDTYTKYEIYYNPIKFAKINGVFSYSEDGKKFNPVKDSTLFTGLNLKYHESTTLSDLENKLKREKLLRIEYVQRKKQMREQNIFMHNIGNETFIYYKYFKEKTDLNIEAKYLTTVKFITEKSANIKNDELYFIEPDDGIEKPFIGSWTEYNYIHLLFNLSIPNRPEQPKKADRKFVILDTIKYEIYSGVQADAIYQGTVPVVENKISRNLPGYFYIEENKLMWSATNGGQKIE